MLTLSWHSRILFVGLDWLDMELCSRNGYISSLVFSNQKHGLKGLSDISQCWSSEFITSVGMWLRSSEYFLSHTFSMTKLDIWKNEKTDGYIKQYFNAMNPMVLVLDNIWSVSWYNVVSWRYEYTEGTVMVSNWLLSRKKWHLHLSSWMKQIIEWEINDRKHASGFYAIKKLHETMCQNNLCRTLDFHRRITYNTNMYRLNLQKLTCCLGKISQKCECMTFMMVLSSLSGIMVPVSG